MCMSHLIKVYTITVFPLISAPRAYQILKLLRASLNKGRHELEGGAYFEIRKMNRREGSSRTERNGREVPERKGVPDFRPIISKTFFTKTNLIDFENIEV